MEREKFEKSNGNTEKNLNTVCNRVKIKDGITISLDGEKTSKEVENSARKEEKKTQIIIVRHGESIGNATRVMLGHTDLDLTELGYRQAECSARRLLGTKIDAVYSSDLKRAKNTARAYATLANMPVICDEDLREIKVGAWEGICVDEVEKIWGDMYTVGWCQGFGTFKFPDGEDVMESGLRFYRAVEKIAKSHLGETVLIATHAGVLRAFWAIISGFSVPISKTGASTALPTTFNCSIAAGR